MNTHTRDSHAIKTPMVESRLQTLLFPPLNTDGSNFFKWVNDAKTILSAEDLAKIFKHTKPFTSTSNSETNEAHIPVVSKWQALVLLRHHMDQVLRLQYLEIDNPADMWAQLHARFHHQQTMFLPQARTDWINPHILNFPNF